MGRLATSLLVSPSFFVIVIVYSVALITHNISLPSRGPLVDTLKLTMSLRNPPATTTLVYSYFASATLLFLSLTEFLKEWQPWSDWLLLAVAYVVKRVWRWCNAPESQSVFVTM
jgi:hypothetical protein